MKVNKFGEKTVNFVFSDQNTGLEYRINNLNCTEEQFMDWLGTFDYEPLEHKYGIHDYAGMIDDNEVVVGFTSYEISKSDFDIVMEIWRKALVEAGFISEDQKVEIVGEEYKPTIVITNPLMDYTEIYEVENVSIQEFEEELDEDFGEFLEDEICGDDYGVYEYDGDQGEGDHLIQMNYEEDDWEKVFAKVVKKIKKYFKYNKISLKLIDNE